MQPARRQGLDQAMVCSTAVRPWVLARRGAGKGASVFPYPLVGGAEAALQVTPCVLGSEIGVQWLSFGGRVGQGRSKLLSHLDWACSAWTSATRPGATARCGLSSYDMGSVRASARITPSRWIGGKPSKRSRVGAM